MYGAILWTTLGEDALAYWMPIPDLPKKEAPAGEDRGQGGSETTTKNESSV